MATAKLRTEGFRAQALEYIRKHPGVLSTALRALAPKFNTDEDRFSKTIWAMRAAGLIVHQRVDPAKKAGAVRYWVPEAAPPELKAEVKLARQLQKDGITMTELRKQQGGTGAPATPKSSKAQAPSAPQKRATRKTKPVEHTAEPSSPAIEPAVESTGKGRKKQVSATKPAPKLESAAPAPTLVTPISLEPAAQQHSLFDEPTPSTPRARARNKAAEQTMEQTALAVPVPQFVAPLDPTNLAAALQPFAGALSDMLAQMVIGQTLQKVQQGLGGLSMALAHGAQQPQVSAPPVAPVAPVAAVAPLNPDAFLAATRSAPVTTPSAESQSSAPVETSTSIQADAAAVAQDSVQSAAQPEVEAVEAQVIRRPMLHPAPVAVEQPKKPKILIVGLLPNQAGIISSEFHEVYDLRFAEADTQPKRLDSMGEDCDRVILMTNFISHSTQDAVKKHPGFERIQGGLTKVKDRLTELFLASDEAA